MGNCTAHQVLPKKKTRGPLINVGESEFDGLMPVANINSGTHILLHGKLKNGEIYYLAPFSTHSGKPLVTCRTRDYGKLRTRRVKIVLTKEQEELLLSGAMKLQCRVGVSKFRKGPGLRRRLKWQPALPTIPEIYDY